MFLSLFILLFVHLAYRFCTSRSCDSPTGGDTTWVTTLTSVTASITVLLWRLDRALMIALAAFWICPRSPSFDRPSCSKDWGGGGGERVEEEEEEDVGVSCVLHQGVNLANGHVVLSLIHSHLNIWHAVPPPPLPETTEGGVNCLIR